MQYLLSNQDLGHEQSSDGGEAQAEPGGPGQTGRSIAEVSVAARLGHLVDSGVGAAGKVHIRGLVALSLLKTALHFNIHDAGCLPNTTEAVLSGVTFGFRG